jgi:hypothetical protein
MSFKDYVAFFNITADPVDRGAHPTPPTPETVPKSDPRLPEQPVEPEPDEPVAPEPDPFPDYRDIPPMNPIARVGAGN